MSENSPANNTPATEAAGRAAVIPPSPSKADYTSGDDYAAQMEANSAPLFEREDPFDLFTEWMSAARAAEINDSNAMSLATVDASGLPDVRMVLLKDFDARGFVFYTNGHSTKGQQLEGTAKAALCLHWKSLRRQVRVRGNVLRVSESEAEAYFTSRARGSQIGAWASDQSAPAESRAELQEAVDRVSAEYEGRDIPRPPHWGGYRVVPEQIEFWRDRPYRLHDRLMFTRVGEGWTRSRLNP